MRPAFFTINFRYWFKFIFVNSKIDKDLKSVIDFFIHFYLLSKKCRIMEILTSFQLFFSISYMYLNRFWLCDNCKAKIKKNPVFQPYLNLLLKPR